MLPRPHPSSFFLSCLLLAGPLAHAQESAGDHNIVQPESAPAKTPRIEGNVRTEYAEVLRVEAIHLPLPAGEQPAQCRPAATRAPVRMAQRARTTGANNQPGSNTDNNRENIMLSLSSGTRRGASTIPSPAADDECAANGQVVYDVDYVLRGVKYRSRLPYDPGNRVRIQLSVTPLVPPEELPPPTF